MLELFTVCVWKVAFIDAYVFALLPSGSFGSDD